MSTNCTFYTICLFLTSDHKMRALRHVANNYERVKPPKQSKGAQAHCDCKTTTLEINYHDFEKNCQLLYIMVIWKTVCRFRDKRRLWRVTRTVGCKCVSPCTVHVHRHESQHRTRQYRFRLHTLTKIFDTVTAACPYCRHSKRNGAHADILSYITVLWQIIRFTDSGETFTRKMLFSPCTKKKE